MSELNFISLLQTGVHWAANFISVFLYLAFGLSYNAVCSSCEGQSMIIDHFADNLLTFLINNIDW